jgi:hypothetical protein
MDIVYAAAPALACVIFTALAITSDQKKQVMKILFLISALASLLVFIDISQQVSTYGEIVVNAENTTYTYNGTGTLIASSSTYNYTNIAPIAAAAYDNLWLIVSVVIWMVFIYLILTLIANGLEIAHRAFFKKSAGLDELG